jgi:hypothetical protein
MSELVANLWGKCKSRRRPTCFTGFSGDINRDVSHRVGCEQLLPPIRYTFFNMWGSKLTSALLAVTALSPQVLAGLTPGTEKCQGYAASNVKKSISGLTADLSLNGNGCAIYGADLKSLKLEVNYETGMFYIPIGGKVTEY